jgi:hypothetical protein
MVDLDRPEKAAAYILALSPLDRETCAAAVAVLNANKIGAIFAREKFREAARRAGLDEDDVDDCVSALLNGHEPLVEAPIYKNGDAREEPPDLDRVPDGPGDGDKIVDTPNVGSNVAAAPAPELDVIDICDLVANVPKPREWLLGNAFCRQFVAALVAPGTGGKTSVRLAQLLSLAALRALTGEYVFLRCRVLFLCLEDGLPEATRRIIAAMKHHGISVEDVKGWFFVTTPSRLLKLLQYDAKGKTAVEGGLKKALHDYLDKMAAAKTPIDHITFDPVKKLHLLNENDNTAMDILISMLADLAIERNMSVDYCSHEAKAAGAEPGDPNRGRGAGAMKDGGRLGYTLTTMSKEEAAHFGLSEEERKRLIRLDSAKVNICAPQTARWFRLVTVNLGNATKTYPSGDDVQTVEPWAPAKMFEGLDSDALNGVLKKLGAGMPDGRKYSTHNSAKDRAAWGVLKEAFPGKTPEQCRAIIATWEKTGVVVIGDYEDSKDRRTVKGIVSTKRVGEKEEYP